VVERDEGPALEGPIEGVEDELGPVDDGESGPTVGAEDAIEETEEPVDADTGGDRDER
jgi:hypothetical protein